ncbi:Glycosyltransferase involved in cell wall bisynthesis [Duganella sp. CF517]|uniref:glycosyltransferase family 4 protein n=1 Tax=Duganella sp. CF517 TaxID=1881038 RepID=UPI0008C4C193|nr:glycosyltransferase family 4 protein [Duganella sp. CF517]SEN84875.1 Glycosyltransferase involved in cell wall bisynthesis [Duganella sp. CF517]
MMEAPVHIGLIGPLPPPPGGMANQTLQLNELLLRDGHRVELVQMNAPYSPAWAGRVPVLRAGVRLLPYLWRLWRVAGKVQLLHVMANSGWSWHLFAAPAIWIARLRGCPVVVNYRGGEADAFLQRAADWVRPSLRRSAALLVPSGFLEAVFRRHGFGSTVVPNVINLERFGAADARATPSAGRAPSVLVARHLEPIYDNQTALRAFALLAARYPAAQLVIAGSGPEADMLTALAEHLGISQAVRFTGRIDNAAMAALYREADIMLNPSLVDNMPNSVLEALAGGVAVVSTDVGGVPYLVEHRRSALLVPPQNPQAMADAMFLLLGEPDLKERLRQAGLQLADQYTWAQVRPRLLQVYRSVIEKANKAGGVSATGGSKA